MAIDSSQLIFYLFSFMIIISAIYVVTLKNIFHSALFLIIALFGVAGIYILLHAEFLAAVQILIYVGAVSVLIIFAIMLTSPFLSVPDFFWPVSVRWPIRSGGLSIDRFRSIIR
jgi:NADH-quinone oxidoreductase subunit J